MAWLAWLAWLATGPRLRFNLSLVLTGPVEYYIRACSGKGKGHHPGTYLALKVEGAQLQCHQFPLHPYLGYQGLTDPNLHQIQRDSLPHSRY